MPDTEHVPVGYEPWNDDSPIRRPNIGAILKIVAMLMLCPLIFGLIAGAWFAYQNFAAPLQETSLIEDIIITPEATATIEMIASTQESTEEITEESTETITDIPPTQTPYIIFMNPATYTPYPTYTEQVPVIIQITSEPVIITQIVTRPPQNIIITQPPVVLPPQIITQPGQIIPVTVISTSISIVTATNTPTQTATNTPTSTPSPSDTPTNTPTYTPTNTNIPEVTSEATP